MFPTVVRSDTGGENVGVWRWLPARTWQKRARILHHMQKCPQSADWTFMAWLRYSYKSINMHKLLRIKSTLSARSLYDTEIYLAILPWSFIKILVMYCICDLQVAIIVPLLFGNSWTLCTNVTFTNFVPAELHWCTQY